MHRGQGSLVYGGRRRGGRRRSGRKGRRSKRSARGIHGAFDAYGASPAWTAVSVYLKPLERRRRQKVFRLANEAYGDMPWNYYIENERLSLKNYLQRSRQAWADAKDDRQKFKQLEKQLRNRARNLVIKTPSTQKRVASASSPRGDYVSSGDVELALSQSFSDLNSWRFTGTASVGNIQQDLPSNMAHYENMIFSTQRQRLLVIARDAEILGCCAGDEEKYLEVVFRAHLAASKIIHDCATQVQQWWKERRLLRR